MHQISKESVDVTLHGQCDKSHPAFVNLMMNDSHNMNDKHSILKLFFAATVKIIGNIKKRISIFDFLDIYSILLSR